MVGVLCMCVCVHVRRNFVPLPSHNLFFLMSQRLHREKALTDYLHVAEAHVPEQMETLDRKYGALFFLLCYGLHPSSSHAV